MIKPVVKWSYIKGAKGLGRAKAHINYIQYREGADREKGPRTFFNAVDKPVTGSYIKQRLDELGQQGVQIHKIVLSPGLPSVNLEEYTREMMTNLARSKGTDLEWYAVRHGNTSHPHAHVVVMGTDIYGHAVQITLPDNQHLRQWGAKYLEREHPLERYLDRLEQLLETNRSSAEIEYIRQRGDKVYESLVDGNKKDRKRKPSATQEKARGDWDLLNELLSNPKPGRNFKPISYKQYQTESAGRLSDFHERYQTREMNEYWRNIEGNFRELAADARRELSWIESLSNDKTVWNQEANFDKLMDGLEEAERDQRTFAAPEIKQLRETTRIEEINHGELDQNVRDFGAFFVDHVEKALREPIERINDKQAEERGDEHDDRGSDDDLRRDCKR